MQKYQSKASFIRSLGKMPAKQIVAKGKRLGMKFSVAYVYTVRAQGVPKVARTRSPKATKATRLTPRQLEATRARMVTLAGALVDRLLKSMRGAAVGDLAAL